jgi:hypothetical protein
MSELAEIETVGGTASNGSVLHTPLAFWLHYPERLGKDMTEDMGLWFWFSACWAWFLSLWALWYRVGDGLKALRWNIGIALQVAAAYVPLCVWHQGSFAIAGALVPLVVLCFHAATVLPTGGLWNRAIWSAAVLAVVGYAGGGALALLIWFPFYSFLVVAFVAWYREKIALGALKLFIYHVTKHWAVRSILGIVLSHTLWMASSFAAERVAGKQNRVEQILADVDSKVSKAQDQIIKLEMQVEDKGHDPRKIGLHMHIRGDQRHILFLYPGDMKGMRVLNLSTTQSYVYLPAFKKVRRIASHLKEQSMFGSDYSFHDFKTLELRHYFDGEVKDETSALWILELKPKSKVKETLDLPYTHMEMHIDKKMMVPTLLRYFNEEKITRTETREDYVCEKGVCMAHKTRMTDHRKNDHWTEVNIKEMSINTGFSNDVFSLRKLQQAD